MTPAPAAAVANKRLLPLGRAGPMPWVVAVMTFLTALSGAAGLTLTTAARSLDRQVVGRATVQIVSADRTLRDAQMLTVTAALRAAPGVRRIDVATPADVAASVAPWLGAAAATLPLPALIDIDLDDPARLPAIRAAVLKLAPTARVDAHAHWLAPLTALARTLRWLALVLVALMGLATAACVALAAQAALDTHRETIGLMHVLGATEGQVIHLFERRIALDALLGGVPGAVAAALALLLLERRIGALGSELATSLRLEMSSWILLLALPLLAGALAIAVTRLTIGRALRASL